MFGPLEQMAEAARRVPGWTRWLVAVVGGLGLMLLVLLVPRMLVPAPSAAALREVSDPAKRQELEADRLRLQNDVRTTLLQGLAGLAVLVGAVYTFRQVQNSSRLLEMDRERLDHTIESSRKQHELDRQAQITERFTRAIDQLGHANTDVQLGGIYALERIANDSPEDRIAIVQVLTAFVRSHAPWPPRRPGQYVEQAPLGQVPPLRVRAVEVQAALTVLARRPPPISPPLPLDLAATDLRGADLQGADMNQANLDNARLQGSRLSDARLQRATLRGAQLEGASLARVQLQYATLTDASLRNARLVGAVLRLAILDGADLQGAELTGAQLQEAILRYAILRGASLRSAKLLDAKLMRADLRKADLVGAKLQRAELYQAKLEGADLTGADTEGVQWEGAQYDIMTCWPTGGDPPPGTVKVEFRMG